MSPTDMEELLERHADHPIRLTLSSGDVLTIPFGDAAKVHVGHIMVFPTLTRGSAKVDTVRYISIVNIAMAEPLPLTETGHAAWAQLIPAYLNALTPPAAPPRSNLP